MLNSGLNDARYDDGPCDVSCPDPDPEHIYRCWESVRISVSGLIWFWLVKREIRIWWDVKEVVNGLVGHYQLTSSSSGLQPPFSSPSIDVTLLLPAPNGTENSFTE